VHQLVNKENVDKSRCTVRMFGGGGKCYYDIMHITLGYQSMQAISATT